MTSNIRQSCVNIYLELHVGWSKKLGKGIEKKTSPALYPDLPIYCTT